MITRNLYGAQLNSSLLGFGSMRFPKTDADDAHVDVAIVEKMVDLAYQNGVNYFDTAYMYHGGVSESVIGSALKKYPRESYMLATKLPVWEASDAEGCKKIFNEQLERCGVDYFDNYLIHCLNAKNIELMRRFGAYELMREYKRQGKIKKLGFSFHGTVSDMLFLLDNYEWDFVQIQLNYLDWDLINAKELYAILTARRLPIYIMEPVRGGALASLNAEADDILKSANSNASIASWAIRFAAGLEGVQTVLSGMSSLEQVNDNLQTINSFTPLSEEEMQVLSRAVDAYKKDGTINCTNCRYCMPCPAGVFIPEVFRLFNVGVLGKNMQNFANKYVKLAEDGLAADKCVECRKCVSLCPQKISIPEKLRAIHKEYVLLTDK